MLNDLRFAIRRLGRAPGFVAVVLLTLALGIGANTAIFSVVDGVLLRALPYPAPDGLVMAFTTYPQFGHSGTSGPDYLDWRDGFASVGELAAYGGAAYTVSGDGAPERVQGTAITPNYFHVLGIAPALGRAFGPEDASTSPPRVVMLGNEYWRRSFGADPRVVGRQIVLNGIPRTIVGVAPATFEYPETHDLIVPQRVDPTSNRRSEYLNVVGRLKPGVSLEQGRAVLTSLAARLAQQYPQTNESVKIDLVSMRDELVGGARRALYVFLGAVGLVLLVACANVANLLLARAATREREVALRTALGAARRRIVRQLLVESVVLSVAGGALGVALAALGVRALKASEFTAIPRLGSVTLDARVLAFAFGLSVVTGLLFGVAPALRLAREGLQGTLRAGGRSLAGTAGGRRTRDVLVLTEVAFAVVLLVGAGLLTRSFARLLDVQPGFAADQVLTAQVALPAIRYGDDARRQAMWTALLGRLRAMPGVRSAATTTSVPFAGVGYWSVTVEGRPRDRSPDSAPQDAQPYLVSDDYFKAMGIPLVRGRVIEARDGAGGAPGAAVVNEEMVRRFWPKGDPIGSRVTVDGETWLTVVGIARDTRQEELGGKPYAQLYLPAVLTPPSRVFLVVRAAGDPKALVGSVRAAVAAVDPELPVYDVQTMSERLATNVARPRVTAALVAIFGVVALALAAVGIYGVVAYSVTERTREFGVRLALGARSTDVIRLVVGQGVTPVLAGLAIGLTGAWFVSRVLASLLFGIGTNDPLTFAFVAIFLGAVALTAAYLPARRATRVDPLTALRSDS
jgi:predicted permease